MPASSFSVSEINCFFLVVRNLWCAGRQRRERGPCPASFWAHSSPEVLVGPYAALLLKPGHQDWDTGGTTHFAAREIHLFPSNLAVSNLPTECYKPDATDYPIRGPVADSAVLWVAHLWQHRGHGFDSRQDTEVLVSYLGTLVLPPVYSLS